MAFTPATWRTRSRTLTTADHTLVMGVLNVTPDSFSDGARFEGADAAVTAGLALWDQGADLVDVGGESTRPGSTGVSPAEELDRVVPVVAALATAGVTVSVDTSKPEVAAACLDAGAEVVNDVTALGRPEMAELCADRGSGVVLMHMQGTPETMQRDPSYQDVVTEVEGFLLGRAGAATRRRHRALPDLPRPRPRLREAVRRQPGPARRARPVGVERVPSPGGHLAQGLPWRRPRCCRTPCPTCRA